MSTIFLHSGGHLPTGDTCGEHLFDCPSMNRIAREFDRGFFTLAGVFCPTPDPSFSMPYEGYQAVAAKTAKIDDVLLLAVVPPKHEVNNLAVEVGPITSWRTQTDVLGLPNAPEAWGAAYGVTFDVVVGVYLETKDANTGVSVYACAPDSEEIIAAGVKADEVSWTHYVYNNVTAADERLGFGLRIKSLPTNTALTLGDMHTMVSLAIKAYGFDTPRQM